MSEATKPYRLKPGKKHWMGTHENGKYVTDEAVVHLTERQAEAFADKFVPASDVAPEVKTAPPAPPVAKPDDKK